MTAEDDADMAEAVELIEHAFDAEVVTDSETVSERTAPTATEEPGARVTRPRPTPPKVTRG